MLCMPNLNILDSKCGVGCFDLSDVNASYQYNPPQGPLSIIYEDDFIMVLNKPSGLLTVPGKKSVDSLTTRVKKLNAEANPIHRLDTSTSGIVLYAKNKNACAFLSDEFRCKRTTKRYCAFVSGIVSNDFGLINYPLAKDIERSSSLSAPYQKVDYILGRKSLTYYEVIERDFKRNITLVSLTPHTGRTHQLRVHLAYLGYPILGDTLYANKNVRSIGQRLCLHAFYLSFRHPNTKDVLRVFCPPSFAEEYKVVNLNPPKRW